MQDRLVLTDASTTGAVNTPAVRAGRAGLAGQAGPVSSPTRRSQRTRTLCTSSLGPICRLHQITQTGYAAADFAFAQVDAVTHCDAISNFIVVVRVPDECALVAFRRLGRPARHTATEFREPGLEYEP